MVVSACTHTELDRKEDEEVINMCQAIADMKRDSRKAGVAEEGAKGKLIQARAIEERLAARGGEGIGGD